MQTVKQQAIFQTPMTQTKLLTLSNSFGWRRWFNPKHAIYAPDHRIMFNDSVDDNDYHSDSDVIISTLLLICLMRHGCICSSCLTPPHMKKATATWLNSAKLHWKILLERRVQLDSQKDLLVELMNRCKIRGQYDLLHLLPQGLRPDDDKFPDS